MIQRPTVIMLACLALGVPGTRSAENAAPAETILRGFLCEGPNGLVRFGEPIAVLGMYGRMADIVERRLSPDLARRFAPLVNQVPSLRNSLEPEFWFNQILLKDTVNYREVPRRLVELKVTTRLFPARQVTSGGKLPGTKRDVGVEGLEPREPGVSYRLYEIQTARLLQAEEIPAPWLESWHTLDQALRDIVATSLKAPGPQKRKQLAAIIEKGSQALQTMTAQKVSREFREQVHQIEPGSRLIRAFQVESLDQWRDQFELYVSRLGLPTATPFPQGKSYPLRQWIAEADTPERLYDEAEQAGGEEALVQRVPYTEALRYNPRLYQLLHLDQKQYRQFQAEVKTGQGRPDLPREGRRPEDSATVKELGVVVREADTNLLRRCLVLGGVVVEKRLAGGPDVGLQPGDLIPNYGGVYDLVMWPYLGESAILSVVGRARQEKELKVFRQDKLISLPLKK